MAKGVVTWCPGFREYFKRKLAQFGSYKKAMIAVVNKLIKVLFACSLRVSVSTILFLLFS